MRIMIVSLIIAALITFVALAAPPATVTYNLDASQSKFMAHANRSGLLWFKGKSHHLAASDFSGQVELTPDTITPASLHLVVKAASLHETGAEFTDQQKQIIDKELKDIVLLPDQYPDITYQSTNVTAKGLGAGRYDVKINGNLTLHGVTRPVMIPATVTLNGSTLRATGQFSIDRDDYKVKATSAAHGLVRVDDDIKFEFDILGRSP
ncbi:MAG TPA: YceI family protein [Pyrinomonadaceae bacterium]|nr:YceI family protein [Pyrinomonadaceae bacterium]